MKQIAITLGGLLLVISSIGAYAQAQEQASADVRRGEALFNSAFVPAPHAVKVREGLGPVYNAAACHNCHRDHGVRTPLPAGQPVPAGMVLQLSAFTQAGHWGPHPVYGEVLNPLSIDKVPTEGRVQVNWLQHSGTFTDGATWHIQQPHIELTQLGYGPLGEQTAMSLRVAQALFGMGLLEQVSEHELTSGATGEVKDPEITGRANWINADEQKNVGRFGWKANHATLRSQIAAALAHEQGVTSSVHPEPICTAAQVACQNAEHGAQPEISDADLNAIIAFVRAFPVPASEWQNPPLAKQGQAIFQGIGCAQCHRPQLALTEGSEQEYIQPYTDLLLHDMGEELADNRPQHEANGREWRTPPLWGIGLPFRLGVNTCYLHDCRARTLEEAILWHGGEATKVKQRYLGLVQTERAALLEFLQGL